MGVIRVKKKDEHEATINDVLYVPSITSNLISLGQLFKNNYTMRLEGWELKVFDEISRIILKAPLSTSRTFKIMINMLNH